MIYATCSRFRIGKRLQLKVICFVAHRAASMMEANLARHQAAD